MDVNLQKNATPPPPVHESTWTKIMLAAILIFTTGGTWEIVGMTSNVLGLALLGRQFVTVVFTDGALLFWHNHAEKYPSAKQRRIAHIMLWETVVTVAVLCLSYMLLSVMGDTWKAEIWEIVIPGWTIGATALQWVDIVMLVFLTAQAVGNLSALVLIKQASPDAERTLATLEARATVLRQQQENFRMYQQAIAPIVGQEQADLATRKQLEALEYTPDDIDRIMQTAHMRVEKMLKQKESATPPPPKRLAWARANWLGNSGNGNGHYEENPTPGQVK